MTGDKVKHTVSLNEMTGFSEFKILLGEKKGEKIGNDVSRQLNKIYNRFFSFSDI